MTFKKKNFATVSVCVCVCVSVCNTLARSLSSYVYVHTSLYLTAPKLIRERWTFLHHNLDWKMNVSKVSKSPKNLDELHV